LESVGLGGRTVLKWSLKYITLESVIWFDWVLSVVWQAFGGMARNFHVS
jgi:hypothetical protein